MWPVSRHINKIKWNTSVHLFNMAASTNLSSSVFLIDYVYENASISWKI